MVTALLTALTLLDIGLLVAVVLLNRRQVNHMTLLSELTEERQLLSDMRRSVQDEMEMAQARNRETLERVTQLAAEAEQEVKAGGDTLAKELEGLISQLSLRLEEPLKELSKRHVSLDALMRKVDQQKTLLQKAITRGEKICHFFDQRVPYEEVLKEIEDKKYADARYLLARGVSADKIALELGMSETEVKLVAELATR